MEHTQSWEERFDEKFGIYSNYADFCPDKTEYMSFISQLLTENEQKVRAEERAKVVEEILKLLDSMPDADKPEFRAALRALSPHHQ